MSVATPAIPPNEGERIAELRRLEILDSDREQAFDRITRLAAKLFDVPIALISLVDSHRQWFKACLGISASETARDVAFCAHTINLDEPLVVADALEDPRFATNPFVLGQPHVRFYAGAPLRATNATNIGTLCVIDTRPRAFTGAEIDTLTELAALVIDELELRVARRTLQRQREAMNRAAEAAERHQTELAIHTAIMHNVLDTAAEGIIVADQSGGFLVYNATATRITGLRPEARRVDGVPEGSQIFRSDGETPFPADELPINRALRGEACDDVEVHFKNAHHPNGILVRATGRPLRTGDGGVHGAVVTFNDITEFRRIERELAALATSDGLTGLPNKRALTERLRLLVAEGGRGRRFAVVMTDVDHFKRVNDTHGHGVGDEVLVAVAGALRKRVRKTDLAARYGGEEFCVLLADATPDDALRVAEELRRAIAALGEPVPVTASFGVACFGGALSDAASLMKAADDALYAAKRGGRDRVVLAGDGAPVAAG